MDILPYHTKILIIEFRLGKKYLLEYDSAVSPEVDLVYTLLHHGIIPQIVYRFE